MRHGPRASRPRVTGMVPLKDFEIDVLRRLTAAVLSTADEY